MKGFSPFKRAHGIDISDFAIRCAEISSNPKGLHIHAYSEVIVEPGCINEGEIRTQDRVQQLCIQLYKQIKGKLDSNYVIIAVPERKTFTKVITIDAVPKAQLADAIQWEAEQQFPIESGEIDLSWTLLDNSEKKQTILISATNRTILDSYTSLLSSLNKYIIVAEPEPLALQRILIGSDPTPTLIIDLGASKTSISIVVGSIIRYTSTIGFSGRSISQSISKSLSLTSEQAEKAKLLFGLNPKKGKGALRKVIAPLFSPLLEHISDLEEYYSTHFESLPPIKKIVLCGGGARLEGLKEYLMQQTKFEVDIRIPAILKKTRLEKQFPENKFSSFATVFGLALRGSTENPFTMISYD